MLGLKPEVSECIFLVLGSPVVFWFKYSFFFFLAALGLYCCAWAFSSCGELELLFVVVCGPLTAVTSPVTEHWLQGAGPSSCGTWAQ